MIEVSEAEATFTSVDPLTGPDVAVTVVDPTATPFTSPVEDTVAKLGADELHVAVLVRSLVLPSL